jgi:hypothetical protein
MPVAETLPAFREGSISAFSEPAQFGAFREGSISAFIGGTRPGFPITWDDIPVTFDGAVLTTGSLLSVPAFREARL